MSEERLYFVAAGRSLEAIEKMMADRQAGHGARSELAKSLGGTGYLGRDSWFAGIIFDRGAVIPAGWRESKKLSGEHRVAVPDRRLKEGRRMDRHMREEGKYTMPSVEAALGGGMRIVGRFMLYPHIERLGDKWVLSVPKAGQDGDQHDESQFVPPDAIPLKTSEYWRMKEEAEAANEGAAS